MKITTVLRGAFRRRWPRSALRPAGSTQCPQPRKRPRPSGPMSKRSSSAARTSSPNPSPEVQRDGAAESETCDPDRSDSEARARATSVNVSADNLDDPAAMEQFAAAAGPVEPGPRPPARSFEAYPQIQSNQKLHRAAKPARRDGKTALAVAIRDYNEAVRKL